jgi:hypothetical protein
MRDAITPAGSISWMRSLLQTGGIIAVVLVCLSACVNRPSPSIAATSGPGQFHPVAGPGIDNFFDLGHGLYSGAAPDGDVGFETLHKLGVKTVISVDGSVPRADLAAKHGLRYVHIPVGYDGIYETNALKLVKAATTLPGPIFVHCHHGMHRGPAAAAILCEGVAGWSPDQAESWLHAAGTATNYPGLYRTVRLFRPPTVAELRHSPADFPARAPTPDLVGTMVQVDAHFDVLKALQKNAFQPLPENPDATAASESLVLYELFHEAARARQGAERGKAFLDQLALADAAAADLHHRLASPVPSLPAGAESPGSAFQALSQACLACHRIYRN